MSCRIIKTLILKDLKLFFRDKFFGLMSIVTIAMFIVFYFILPRAVNEKVEIGYYAPYTPGLLDVEIEEEGIVIRNVETEDELKHSVISRDFHIGISIPGDIHEALMSGEEPELFIYYSSEVPDEVKELYTILVNEMINEFSGLKMELTHHEIVLGPDMGGKQVPHRDRLLPVMAFMLLIMETMGLANLITSELGEGRVQALLTTPMNVTDLFVGKGVTGVLLAFTQTILLMMVTGGMEQNTALIVVTLLLGSIMLTGLSFYIASISRDMMSVIAWSTLMIIVLTIPVFSIMIPGLSSGWERLIPSYYVVNTLHATVNYNVGWGGNLNNILALIGLNSAFILIGIISLRRKIA